LSLPGYLPLRFGYFRLKREVGVDSSVVSESILCIIRKNPSEGIHIRRVQGTVVLNYG